MLARANCGLTSGLNWGMIPRLTPGSKYYWFGVVELAAHPVHAVTSRPSGSWTVSPSSSFLPAPRGDALFPSLNRLWC